MSKIDNNKYVKIAPAFLIIACICYAFTSSMIVSGATHEHTAACYITHSHTNSCGNHKHTVDCLGSTYVSNLSTGTVNANTEYSKDITATETQFAVVRVNTSNSNFTSITDIKITDNNGNEITPSISGNYQYYISDGSLNIKFKTMDSAVNTTGIFASRVNTKSTSYLKCESYNGGHDCGIKNPTPHKHTGRKSEETPNYKGENVTIYGSGTGCYEGGAKTAVCKGANYPIFYHNAANSYASECDVCGVSSDEKTIYEEWFICQGCSKEWSGCFCDNCDHPASGKRHASYTYALTCTKSTSKYYDSSGKEVKPYCSQKLIEILAKHEEQSISYQ